MDKDRIKGKVKDVAGRLQRQGGEWTGDEESQAKGAAKQAEGKVQNAWGQVKDAGRQAMNDAKKRRNVEVEEEKTTTRKRRIA
jgi:uncharacterized protein YjbJ (UPF0337 family)